MNSDALEKELNHFLQTGEFRDGCPNGLQIEGKKEIKKGAFAVSASLYTVQKAVELGADALFVHHGIFWDKVPQQIVKGKREKIALIIENNLNLFAYHLPLDSHQEVGNNWVAAKDLGWKNLEPFGSFQGSHIGVMGTFKEKKIEAFQKELEAYYGSSARVALGGKDKVSSCALISGGAHWSISEALEKGVDCFITGSCDEPIYTFAMDEGINFLSLGHHHTERVGPKALMAWMKETYGIEGTFIEEENPF